MFDVQSELTGLRVAREEARWTRLLADVLTDEVRSETLDAPSQQRLFQVAAWHGVLGLFPLSHPEFEGALLAARARHLRALKFTRRVVDAIEGAGIPVAVMKGVVAASRWPDSTLRQQSDVDVLVETAHKDRASQALIEARVCARRFAEAKHMHNDSLLSAEPSGLLVEVHHYFNAHHRTDVSVAELLARRVRVPTAQGTLPAMTPEDDAVYLGLHATTHAVQRLAWLVDLASLAVDWVEAARRARRWGVALAVEPAWRLTRTLLRAPIPNAAFDALGIFAPHAQLAAGLLKLSDASRGELRRLFERCFRLSVVPARALPAVLAQIVRARREEEAAYAQLR